MPLKTDTTHSKMASQCQECIQHHTHNMHATQGQPTQRWGYQEHMRHHTHHMHATKADTTHSKMDSRYQERMRHHTHHMCATQGRHNHSKMGSRCQERMRLAHTQPTDGFSIPRHVTPHTHGFSCMRMRHHTHHMHATQDRHNPLKDGFSMPRAHATSHTQHACHPRQTQPTQRWVLHATSHTPHVCNPRAKMGSHTNMTHTHHMHATQDRHNPLKDGFSMPRAHARRPHRWVLIPCMHTHQGMTQPTQRWVLDTKSACDTTHTTCMQPKADRTQPTQRWVLDTKSACDTTHTTCMPLKTDTTHSKMGSRYQERMQHTHTPHDTTHSKMCNPRQQCQDMQHTHTCMQPKADTTHSKMGFRYQERM